jgi:glycosyltransferase involved in cell wall biosynthesis
MKILIITDTWNEPINGVIVTLQNLIREIKILGHEVDLIEPSMFKTIPCPGYKTIPLAVNVWKIAQFVQKSSYDAFHIVSEGPIGVAAKLYLDRKNIPYTTAYHTKFPEFVESKYPRLKADYTYKFMNWFHSKSTAIFVPTESVIKELTDKGFKNLVLWTRGVDREIFFPINVKKLDKPTLLNVGRVSIEKNLEEFYKLDIDAYFIQVGDGPQLEEYKEKYRNVQFVGKKSGIELATYYNSADAFVFPSKTDTFGLVMIEAMACGTPVAAYPVASPIDVVNDYTGSLKQDLKEAVQSCLKLDRRKVEEESRQFSWEKCAEIFLDHLAILKEVIVDRPTES